jgi:hypothetical protein
LKVEGSESTTPAEQNPPMNSVKIIHRHAPDSMRIAASFLLMTRPSDNRESLEQKGPSLANQAIQSTIFAHVPFAS